MAKPRHSNARVHLVHLRGARTADHFLVSPDVPGFGVGVRVHVRLPDGSWHDGVVDNRTGSEAGGAIMVTLDNVPTH